MSYLSQILTRFSYLKHLYFFATFTMLYAGTFTVHVDKRSDGSTYFASMSEEALAAESGPDAKMLGRWHNPADGSG
jgi:hypothetical protein